MTAKKRGRKSNLTPELQSKLTELIAAGNTIENACAMSKVPKRTVYDWINKGENGISEEYIAFNAAIKEARATSEDFHVRGIVAAADKSWQAHAWFLERSNPDKWALRKPDTTVAVTVENNGPSATDEAFRAFITQFVNIHPELREEVVLMLKAVST